MGNSYSSRTNLNYDCTYFHADSKYTILRWGDSIEVCTGNWKEDHNEFWAMEYKTGQKLEHSCQLQLLVTRDEYGVKNIRFGLRDSAHNKTEFELDMKRIGHDGFRGGISGIQSSGAHVSRTKNTQDFSIDTNVVSYNCSHRDGFFVIQMTKMNYSDEAHHVFMAHYYVTKAVGLHVEAIISRSKGKGFVIEVKAPCKNTSAYMCWVVEESRRQIGLLPPKAKSITKTGDSSSSLKINDNTIGQIVKHASNKGLINSNGSTKGALNHSIFIDCKFA